ncbi:undecaprenyl-phosphate glucose phosphotransferase [Pedobacter sp. LMG 31464]|uniref:Undecaprenyl-phosphate glucose phosphotransferase n=1 Tax=Pedobacter planticolens TaxID=2679964 RepID=A0A923DXK8_9SPHI|nr:undecaprenyl-phosphate glucose phosphotransferase [Pedobacter planticolens]
MKTRYFFLLSYILPIIDLFILNAAYYGAYFVTGEMGKILTEEIHKDYVVVCNLIWLVSTAIFSLYTIQGEKKLERIYRSTWRSIVLHFIMFSIYLIFLKGVDFSRTFLIVFYGWLSLGFILNRFICTSLQYVLINKYSATLKVAIMGSNYTALRLSNYLTKDSNVEFYGSVGGDESIYFDKGAAISKNVARKFTAAAMAGVKEVYVAIAPKRMAEVQALLDEADKQGVRLKFIPDLGLNPSTKYTINYFGEGFPMITLRDEPLEEISARFKKRLFDFLFSSIVIVFLLSWLIPVIALVIRLDSKGSIFFLQTRAGRDNKLFKVFKFRTMAVTENDSEYTQAKKGDARITRVGSFLRSTSLDELPQFINVLLGDMSVVGPRPHPLLMNDYYQEVINKYMVRHFVKPGITGWAQVNGFRGETKEKEDMENRVKYDIYYLENWTAMFDVRIVFMTIINLVRGEDNAY